MSIFDKLKDLFLENADDIISPGIFVQMVGEMLAREHRDRNAVGYSLKELKPEQYETKVLDKRETFLKKIEEFEKKFTDQNSVPRPPHWSGWRISPSEIEFWLDGEGRIHERLVYLKEKEKWVKKLLYP